MRAGPVPVLGDAGDAAGEGGAGRPCAAGGPAGEEEVAGRWREGAGDEVGERGLAVAGDAGEAGDAAAPEREVEGVQAGGGDGAELEEGWALRHGRDLGGGDVGADHQASELVAVGVAGGDLADEAAVAEDEDAVGDGHHLAELVGDEDDGEALGDREAEGAEEGLGLLRREDGGGLVEDEDAGVAPEGLEDFHPLALADGEIGDAGGGVDGEAEAPGEVADAACRRRRGRGSRAGGCRGGCSRRR